MNILITGSASGLGYNTGINLAREGYHVFLTTENDKQLEVLNDKVKNMDNIDTFKLDITNKNDLKKLEKKDIDILISNAAVGYGGSIIDIDTEKFRHSYEVNVLSNFELIKKVINKMIENGNGKIIIMSSMISNISIPFFGIYAGTKASITMTGKCLRKEIKAINKNIKVCIIEPGLYKTGFNRFMIENKYNEETIFKDFYDSIRNLENEILDFSAKKKYDSITKQIIKAVKEENPKEIYRAPMFQNLLIKLYIKFLKK